LAVLAGRDPEGDRAPEASGPRHRLVENGGAVGGAHEEEVVAGRAQGRDAQRQPAAVGAQLARQEEAVEREVDSAPDGALEEAGVVDAVHQDEEGVEAQLAAPEHAAHAAHAAAAAHTRSAVAARIELVDEDRAAAPAL